MSDPSPEPQRQHRECPDCHARPDNCDTRIVTFGLAGDSTETWHLDDCPQHAIDKIMSEESNRQFNERQAWAKVAFPAALERLKAAADSVTDEAAAPFVAALTELVQAEVDGVFMPHARWAELLERHFPPQD